MKKYSVLIAAICINLCLGGVYAWSVFVPALVNNYAYNTTQTQIIFGTVIFLLTSTMLFTGKLETRIGPSKMLMICAALIFAGYTIAGLSQTRLLWLWSGYGAITGIAIGFGYVTVLSVSMRWFFNRKGLAAGMVIAGYGFGAIILSFAAQALLNRNWDVMNIFRLIGITFGSIIFSCSIIVSNPPGYKHIIAHIKIRHRQILLKPKFLMLAIATGIGTFPGLMIIGNLKPIALSFGYTEYIAVLAISLLSAGNAAGRIAGGYTHDIFKAPTLKWILLLVTLSALLLSLTSAAISPIFLAVVLLIGISYGGLLSNIPAQVADEYGHEHFGTVYPMVIMVHGMAALFAAPIGGYFYDRYETYIPAILIAAAVGLICLLLFMMAYRKSSSAK